MALQYLDTSKISDLLTQMWKRKLGTDEDPANGRWYTSGSNGDSVGLYGGLTDAVSTTLQFDQAHQEYVEAVGILASSEVDNMDGTVPGPNPVTLNATYSTINSTSHTTTNSIKVGIGLDIKGKTDFFVVEGEVTAKFSLEYSHSWGDTTGTTTSQSQSLSQTLNVSPPKGKIYKAVLQATTRTLKVPYTATIFVDGITETWFEDRIQDHYNWSMGAGQAFSQISSQLLAGGADSQYYGASGGRGTVIQKGTVSGQWCADFKARVYDVTGSSPAAAVAAMSKMASVFGSPMEPAVPEAPHPDWVLVEEVAITR